MAKSGVKPIFSPPPHPSFFAPKSPFFPLFPVLSPFSGDFSRKRTRFLPCEAHFFLVFPRFGANFGRFFEGSSSFFPVLPSISFTILPILNPNSDDFSRERHSFQPRNSLFPCFSRYFPKLRALLREISPIIFLALPFSHRVKAFSFRAPSFFTPCTTFISRSTPLPFLIPLPLRSPPLSFSFLPTFPSPSPINARSRALSRTTRVRVRLHIPTRQEVFVYCLHRFTHLPQSTVHQHIRCEGKTRKSLHKIHIHLIINELTIEPRFHPP